MLYLTEIKCFDYSGEWTGYFYVYARRPIRNLKDIMTNKMPNGLRLVLEDQYWTPYAYCGTLNPFTFIFRKYFKKRFSYGWRINWEKEAKKL